jgi:hypothetical protein
MLSYLRVRESSYRVALSFNRLDQAPRWRGQVGLAPDAGVAVSLFAKVVRAASERLQ